MPTLTGESLNETTTTAPRIEIRALRIGEDGTAFRTLNEEWITHFFKLEDKDREVLGDPENRILRIGGSVFMVYADGVPVGCVALIPMENGVYELAKMAVSPTLRGHQATLSGEQHEACERRASLRVDRLHTHPVGGAATLRLRARRCLHGDDPLTS